MKTIDLSIESPVSYSDQVAYSSPSHGAPSHGSPSPERGALVKELSEGIRSLETANRPIGNYITSGSLAMDRCLASRGYHTGSFLELTFDTASGSAGWGGMSLALKLAQPWLADGKYLVVVDSQRRLHAPSLLALKIPLERLIVIRTENEQDWVWGVDQSLRSRAVGALITPAGCIEDRVARRWQLGIEQGGGLGILLRERSIAKRSPSWAEVQWQVRSVCRSSDERGNHSAGRLANDSNYGKLRTPSAIHSARWFDLELLRAPGLRSKNHLRLGIDSRGDWIECTPQPQTRDDQKSSESTQYLVAQLAMAEARRRNMAAG